MPQAPSYDESQAMYSAKSLESARDDQADGWISGKHEAHRTVAFVYNPNPTGQVNELDEQVSGFAHGVGVYEWRMVAEEVSHRLHLDDIAVTLVIRHARRRASADSRPVAYCSLAALPLDPA